MLMNLKSKMYRSIVPTVFISVATNKQRLIAKILNTHNAECWKMEVFLGWKVRLTFLIKDRNTSKIRVLKVEFSLVLSAILLYKILL